MKRPGGFDRRVEAEETPQPSRRGRHPRGGAGGGAHGGVPNATPEADGTQRRKLGDDEAAGEPVHRATVETGAGQPEPEAETVDLSDLAAPPQGRAVSLARRGDGSRAGALARFAPSSREVDPVKAAEKRLRKAERQTKKRRRRETKRFTAAARRARRRLFIAGGTVAGLVAFVMLGAFTPIMSVRDIRIEGAQNVNSEEISKALAGFEGVPLALVDENAVLRSLEGFPRIQRFAVERVPPHTLVVRIEERVPVVALEEEGTFHMYDAAGVLVAEAAERPEGVPAGGDGLRSTSSKGFHAASKVLRDMPEGLRGQVAAVNAVSGQDVTLQLANGIEVFWGNADETKRKSLVLETMLTSLKDRSVTLIDVSSTEAPIFK